MIKKIVKWVVGILILLIVGLLVYGSISQYSYDKKVVEQFKPTGKFIELSENRIHYQFFGEGKFTFVLEAGLGKNMQTWSVIQDSLAKIGKVFMYERSRLGFIPSANLYFIALKGDGVYSSLYHDLLSGVNQSLQKSN